MKIPPLDEEDKKAVQKAASRLPKGEGHSRAIGVKNISSRQARRIAQKLSKNRR